MMVALHRRALLVLSLIASAIGAAIGAAAQGTVVLTNVPQPVTHVEMYVTLATVLSFGGLGFAGVLAWILSWDRAATRATLAEFKEVAAGFHDALLTHNERRDAHYEASHANHDPMDRRIAAIEAELADAIEKCLVRRLSEDCPREKRRATDPHTGGPNDSGPDFGAANVTYPRHDGERHD